MQNSKLLVGEWGGGDMKDELKTLCCASRLFHMQGVVCSMVHDTLWVHVIFTANIFIPFILEIQKTAG